MDFCIKKSSKIVEKKQLGGYNDVVARSHNLLIAGANSTGPIQDDIFDVSIKGDLSGTFIMIAFFGSFILPVLGRVFTRYYIH